MGHESKVVCDGYARDLQIIGSDSALSCEIGTDVCISCGRIVVEW